MDIRKSKKVKKTKLKIEFSAPKMQDGDCKHPVYMQLMDEGLV